MKNLPRACPRLAFEVRYEAAVGSGGGSARHRARHHRPNLFIVGAPKSGTTSMFEYLRGHPDVYMSPVKEPFYFAPDVVVAPRARLRYPDMESYLSLFGAAQRQALIGEASTNYLVSREAPQLIREFADTPRAIVMVRNPVEMVHALHSERVSQGVEPLTDFTAAWSADDDRRAGRRLPDGCTPLGAIYREAGFYGEQLERWFDALGREQVHVIVFDDLAADTPGTFRRTLEFLGVDSSYVPRDFAVHNPSHRMRGGLVDRAARSLPARSAVRSVLPRLIGDNATATLARSFRHSRLRRQAAQRTALTPDLAHDLSRTFAPDIDKLSQLLERDVSKLWLSGSESAL